MTKTYWLLFCSAPSAMQKHWLRIGGSMTDDRAARLAAIREREAKATPGAWVYCPAEDWIIRAHVSGAPAQHYDSGVVYDEHREVSARDATFIAHAREDIPWLLAEVDRLNGALRIAELARDSLATVTIASSETTALRAQLADAQEREARLRASLEAAIGCLTELDLPSSRFEDVIHDATVLLLDPPAKPEGS